MNKAETNNVRYEFKKWVDFTNFVIHKFPQDFCLTFFKILAFMINNFEDLINCCYLCAFSKIQQKSGVINVKSKNLFVMFSFINYEIKEITVVNNENFELCVSLFNNFMQNYENINVELKSAFPQIDKSKVVFKLRERPNNLKNQRTKKKD